jgi:hypothetical protein
MCAVIFFVILEYTNLVVKFSVIVIMIQLVKSGYITKPSNFLMSYSYFILSKIITQMVVLQNRSGLALQAIGFITPSS